MTEPILSVRDLKKHYPIKAGMFNRQVGAARAVDGISFDIEAGETLGLVGESGCGKSTAATSIIRLEEATDGEVIFNGGDRAGTTRNEDGTHPNDVTRFDKVELKAFRREAQMIFQDPSSSFDPRMSVGGTISEMLMVHGMNDRHQRRAIVEDLLERVGMSADDYDRYPHEFSGGQKQRIALARALVLNPDLIIADEPVSALDVSVQAEVLALIDDLQDEFGLSLLLISHDMGVIQAICDRVAVMYLGKIVEIGSTEEIFTNPRHPYTEALLSSIPTPDPHSRGKGIKLFGTVPDPSNPPAGCLFHTRCPKVVQPEAYDLDQLEFRRLIHLRYQLAADAIDLDQIIRVSFADSLPEDQGSIRSRLFDRLGVGSDNARNGEGPSDADLKSQIRTEFGLPERLSDTSAELVLEEALDNVVDGDSAAAHDLIATEFATPCEQTEPDFTDHDDGHRSACIRHTMDVEPIEAAADDD